MTDSRPPIPAALERDLMIEAGYRCAVCKATEPLQIDHISEWAKVKKHEFENMIVLCANCYARKKKSSDPRHINRASVKLIKSNLMMLNSRYSDLERRVIESFQRYLQINPDIMPLIVLPDRLGLLVQYLVQDGFVAAHHYKSPMSTQYGDGTQLRDDNLKLTLTPKGHSFLKSLEPS